MTENRRFCRQYPALHTSLWNDSTAWNLARRLHHKTIALSPLVSIESKRDVRRYTAQ